MNSLDISTLFCNKSILPIHKLCKIDAFRDYAFQIILSIRRLLPKLNFNWMFLCEHIFIYLYPIICDYDNNKFGISHRNQLIGIYLNGLGPVKVIIDIFSMLYFIFKTYNDIEFPNGIEFPIGIFKSFNLKFFDKLEINKLNKEINKINNNKEIKEEEEKKFYDGRTGLEIKKMCYYTSFVGYKHYKLHVDVIKVFPIY